MLQSSVGGMSGSTFVNSLANSERMIVGEVPEPLGDMAIDVVFELDGQSIVAIDIGLRKRKKPENGPWSSTAHQPQKSIRRADVVLMFFDAMEPVSKVDKQLMGYVMENHKPDLFVDNKWDLLAGDVTTDQWVSICVLVSHSQLRSIAFITGQKGQMAKALLNHATMLFKQARKFHWSLNRLIQFAVESHQPPLYPEQTSEDLLRDSSVYGTTDDRTDVRRT